MNRLKAIKKYWILTELSFQIAMVYRVHFFLSLLAGLIQALILYYIWQAVFVNQIEVNGFTLSQIVTYIFVSYAIKNLYSFTSEVNISIGIRDGSVAMDLIKPLNYQLARLFESLGLIAIEGILISILVLALGVVMFEIHGPPGQLMGAAFGVSLVLSLLVNFSISYIVGMFSFWTTSLHLFSSKRFVMDFFSGALVPLAFFPDWLQDVAFVLPFYSVVHLPVSIYLGRIEEDVLYGALLPQLFWCIVLWAVGSLMWSQASKKITIHGG